jgi:hypothetical protein
MIDQSNPIETSAEAAPPSAQESRRVRPDSIGGVRSTDLEPYTGLRYLSTLFRIMAVILLIVLVAEVVAGIAAQGTASLPTVLGEASRLIVLAGVLWGTGDLAMLLIDVGHDVRATRIFLARQVGHQPGDGVGASPDGRAGEVQRDVGRESSVPPLADR